MRISLSQLSSQQATTRIYSRTLPRIDSAIESVFLCPRSRLAVSPLHKLAVVVATTITITIEIAAVSWRLSWFNLIVLLKMLQYPIATASAALSEWAEWSSCELSPARLRIQLTSEWALNSFPARMIIIYSTTTTFLKRLLSPCRTTQLGRSYRCCCCWYYYCSRRCGWKSDYC